MNATIPDLWPTDIVQPRQTAPAAILRQQGYLLGQKTQNFVVGEVQSAGNDNGTSFKHSLYISAPLLNVRVLVCFVTHGRAFYPSTVVAIELTEDYTGTRQTQYAATNEEQFNEVLKAILARDQVKSLVQSLADQCRDLKDETAP